MISINNTLAWIHAAKYALINSLMLAFVYFLPAISHLFAFPFYLADPMRLMIMLAFIHTGRVNSFIMALTLPAFSFLISSHPVLFKSMLISLELFANCLFLIFLMNKKVNLFFAFFISIALSKCFYYFLKYLLLSFNYLDGSLISTPLEIQMFVTLIISIYGFLILSKQQAVK